MPSVEIDAAVPLMTIEIRDFLTRSVLAIRDTTFIPAVGDMLRIPKWVDTQSTLYGHGQRRMDDVYEVTGREWALIEESPYVTLSVALRPSEEDNP